MRIIQKSDSRMRLQDMNAGSFFVGGLFVVTGTVASIYSIALLVSKTASPPLFVMGPILLFMGLLVITGASIIDISLDKESGKCIFNSRKLLGKKTMNWKLNEIWEVRLTRVLVRGISLMMHGMPMPAYRNVLIFILKTGRQLPFEFGYNVPSLFDILRDPNARIRTDARQVAAFLGVPFTETGPPTMSDDISVMSKRRDV